jgi:hypothetical protein
MKIYHYRPGRTKVYRWGGDLEAVLRKPRRVWFRLRLNRIDGHSTSADVTVLNRCWGFWWRATRLR